MTDTQGENWLSDLLPRTIELARQAGSAVMHVYKDLNPSVEYKSDQSPLTQADMASHHIIVEGLARMTPEWPVLSEESVQVPFEERCAWRRFWLVDPLDGTKEFLRRNGEFTVNIALIEDSRPILGVVSAPALNTLYYAAHGAGAWKECAGAVERICTGRVPNGPMRVMVSRAHATRTDDLSRWTGSGEHTCMVMGSSLKFCLVADGTADLYPRLGPTMEWDTAAAECILEVAGGRVVDLHGQAMMYNKQSLLNPGFVARGEK